MIRIENFINGLHLPPRVNSYLPCYEPATGALYAEVPDSGPEDVDLAVLAAEQALLIWSGMSQAQRHDILMNLSYLIKENLNKLAQAESRDTGKPIKLAKQVDIPRAVDNFKFFASSIMHFASESHHMPGVQAINYTLRQPLGIVACISPWNLPLYLLSWKIAPALAAGNVVIAKPSEVTPMTAYLLSKLCKEAGLPPGVLNIIHGAGPRAGQALVEHPKIKAISFTGGTATGRRIAKIAAPQLKKISLELGGKNPNIIFADCDYDKALSTAVKAAYSNQGQICLCGSRIFIERSFYDRFKADFVEKVSRLRIGDPSKASTQVGALTSASHRDKVLAYIELAIQEGGHVICGGEVPSLPSQMSNGYYVAPTAIENLSFDCRTNQEEIFGPVVTLTPFDTEEELLLYANSVSYGLSATIWTADVSRAHRLAEKVDAGIIWVNCWLLRDLRTPFGGMKDSGVGREGGLEAMRFFTEPKNVCIQYGA